MKDAASIRLVFNSVKMGAAISLNGHVLGNTTNQHLRYTFEVAALLVGGSNTVVVRFDRSIETGGRFMGCSGGWDRAPYSRMRDSGGRAEWTRGITGSVYLAATAANAMAIDALSPSILFNGAPPTAVLKDDGTHSFGVNVTVHLAAKGAASGRLEVTGTWPAAATKSVPVKMAAASGGTMAVSVVLEASGVKLWWPRGMGDNQTMYTVSARFVSVGAADGSDASSTTKSERRIGFRTAYLTTGNDTDSAWVAANAQGNGNANPANTMMFRINGAPTVTLIVKACTANW